MMMACLEAGGIECCYDESREKINNAKRDACYIPNKLGLKEIKISDYYKSDFPEVFYEGKAIKVLCWGLPHLRTHRYKVIYMTRNPNEIEVSFKAFFGWAAKLPIAAERILAMNQGYLKMLNGWKDTEVLEVNYNKFIHNPIAGLIRIKEFGVPININEAIKVVDKTQYRHAETTIY